MPVMSKEKIKDYLLERDSRLLPVIQSVKYPVSRRNTDVYGTLLQSVISQQLSVKAAATIHKRVLELFPDNNPHPDYLVRISTTRLRNAGLSKQKAGYLKAIARFAVDEGLDYAELSRQSDSALISHLTQIHGIGQWTVEMLLMFTFNRRDVMPVDDIGIQNAMRRLYGIKVEGREFKRKLLHIAKPWQPYRTIVCKYLWGWKSNGYNV